MTISKQFLISVAERVGVAAVSAFVATLVPPISLTEVHAGEAAAYSAAVTVVVSALANLKTKTASLFRGIEVGGK